MQGLADFTFKRNSSWVMNTHILLFIRVWREVFYRVFRKRRIVRFTSGNDGAHSQDPISKHYFNLAGDTGARSIQNTRATFMVSLAQKKFDTYAGKGKWFVQHSSSPAHFHSQISKRRILL